MACAIPYDIRKLIISKRQSGLSFPTIAKELNYSLSGVKKIWYTYQRQGTISLKPQYHKCGRKSLFDETIHQAIAKVKTGNQGAPFVFSRLKQDYAELSIPSIRTLQRWWQKNKTGRGRGRPNCKEKKVGHSKFIILGR